MPSTYTANLGLEQPATGEQAGVWGATANNSYKFLDDGIDGNITVQLSASAYTLLTSQGADSLGRNKVIVFTGTLTVDGSISIAPNTAKKIYFVINRTTGGFALNFSQQGGTGGPFKLLNGYSAVIYADGQGSGAGVFGALSDLQTNSLLVQTNLVVNGSIKGATISPPMTINLGGDASYDMYYRSVAGPVARLAAGTAGQQLTAGTGGIPAWANPSLPALPFSIGGSSPNYIYTANASGQMWQDPNLLFVAGQGMGVGMVPGHALCLGRGLPAVIQLDAVRASPGARQLLCTSDGLLRWQMAATAEVEAGSPANSTVGCNFGLSNWNNDQSVNLTSWVCYRNGRMTIGNVYNDSYDAKLTVTNAGGVASTNIQAWLNSAGTTMATVSNSGNMNITGQYQVNGAPLNTAGGLIGVQVSADGYAQHVGPFTWLEFTGIAGITCSWGGAAGPGNNTANIQFTAPSDLQLKRNVESLTGGLPIIAQLRPVTAEWNGLGGMREGERLVSVIGQELQEVLPDAVSPYRTRLRPEDDEPAELLSINSMVITAHLILAVQQLDERLKALEP